MLRGGRYALELRENSTYFKWVFDYLFLMIFHLPPIVIMQEAARIDNPMCFDREWILEFTRYVRVRLFGR